MTTNTLETAYVNGAVIDASHINELTLSLLGEFVGRNSNGIPTQGQSLGTAAIEWGNLYAQNIILNGQALDTSAIVTLPNRIISGATRSLSMMPDYIRANGASLAYSVLGATTNLILSIDNIAVTVSTDIAKTGITAAPSTSNTCLVNDTTMSNDLYAGEDDYTTKSIIIDNAGTEITSRVGQIAAFETATGEIMMAYIKSATELVNVKRGYYFDDSGDPIGRGNLSNNDTLTLLLIGWVFIEDNGTTVDTSYRTPYISFDSPDSPQTGDYWLDLGNNIWKRYSGTAWEIIDRILIGQIVSDTTKTVASRSYDFTKTFEEANNVKLVLLSTEIAGSKTLESRVSVYGEKVDIDYTKTSWNITTDLETGQTEAISTYYYAYISGDGEPILSNIKPYLRNDLKGYYHPYHTWRCLGEVYNDASNNFSIDRNSHMYNKYNPNAEMVNRFSAAIENDGTATILSQSSPDNPAIASVSRSSTGIVNIVFTTGFFTEIPVIVSLGAVTTDYRRYPSCTVLTTSGATIVIGSDNSTNFDANFHVVLEKQSTDYLSDKE